MPYRFLDFNEWQNSQNNCCKHWRDHHVDALPTKSSAEILCYTNGAGHAKQWQQKRWGFLFCYCLRLSLSVSQNLQHSVLTLQIVKPFRAKTPGAQYACWGLSLEGPCLCSAPLHRNSATVLEIPCDFAIVILTSHSQSFKRPFPVSSHDATPQVMRHNHSPLHCIVHTTIIQCAHKILATYFQLELHNANTISLATKKTLDFSDGPCLLTVRSKMSNRHRCHTLHVKKTAEI